jgi:PAS domain S-box-containing protein
LTTQLFDSNAFEDADEAVEFIGTVLEASTEYSIIGTDLDGKILLWNMGARRLYGYEPHEMLGRPKSVLHTDDVSATGGPEKMLETALRDGKWEGTLHRRRKDGSHFPARVVCTPRRSAAGGAPTGFLLIASDISEEVRVTRKLEETQAYTRSLIESDIDALMTTDPLGVMTDVNEKMVALTGHTRGELIGSPFKGCFTEPDRAEEGIKLTLSEGKVTNYELTARAKDGRETFVSYNASTFTDRAGKLQGVFAVARDVTERKNFEIQLQKTNVELEAADFAKDRFLTSMSHELRTPLNAILGFTGTMLMELPGPLSDEQRKQLGTIRTNGRHLLSIINDLLDLAKIESGKIELELEPLTCHDMLEEVVSGLRQVAQEKGIDLQLRVPEEEVVVRSDRRSLSQIMINLTNNAIKFTDEGSVVIELDNERKNGNVVTRFNVVDTGMGIRQEDQEKLFARFEQLERSATRRYEGTGLGLYISQRLATLIDGDITFESEFGKGTKFVLELTEKA